MTARIGALVALLLIVSLLAVSPTHAAQSDQAMPTPTAEAIRFAEPADLSVDARMVFVVARFATEEDAATARSMVVTNLRDEVPGLRRTDAPDVGDAATMLTDHAGVVYLAVASGPYVHIWDIEVAEQDWESLDPSEPLTMVAETVLDPDHSVPPAGACQSDLLDRLPHEEDLPTGWLADNEELRYDDELAGCPETSGSEADVVPPDDPVESASRMFIAVDDAVSEETRVESLGFNIFQYESQEDAAEQMDRWVASVIDNEGLQNVRTMQAPEVGDQAILIRGHTARTLGGEYDTAFLFVQDGANLHVWKANGLRAAAGPVMLTEIALGWIGEDRSDTETLESQLPGLPEVPAGYVDFE